MKALMRAAGQTQEKLSKRLKVSQSLISQWVRGICEPRIEQLPELAAALGVSVEQVIECFTKKGS